ncbi:MAG: PAS domain S-box protein [Flavobacteriales bacterium]|nr:PAS domain S-box protein [Flavobacteriales bacterium]
MELPQDPHSKDRFHTIRSIAALVVVALSVAVLAGWQLNVDVLKRPIPGSVAMNPLTAICFILSSLALLNLRNGRLLRVFAWFLMALSSAKLLSMITALHIPVDTFIFHGKLASDKLNGISNSMAPNTAVGFLWVGIAFELRRSKKIALWFIELSVMLVLVQGLISTIGYGFKVPEFYGVLNMFPMAIHTAMCFLIIACGMLLVRPMGPFMSTMTDKGAGGIMARTLLPMAILVPIVLGALRLYGAARGIFSTEFGLMLVVVSVIGSFCLAIWKIADVTNKHSAEQKLHEKQLALANANLEKKVAERTETLLDVSRELEEKAKELEISEKRFRALVENGGDAVLVVNGNFSPIYVSESITRMLGYSPAEVMEIDLLSLIHHDDLEGVQQALGNAMENPGIPVPGHTSRTRHKDGSWRWLEATITNLLHDPAVNGIVDNFRDVTERVEAKQRLAASEVHFRQTLDNMMEGVQIIGHDWTYQYVNLAVTVHGAMTAEQMLGKTIMECYPGIEQTEVFSQMQRVMNERTTHHMENLFDYPDGSQAWFELSIQPVPEGIFILSIDITDRKKAEAAIAELNASLEQKVEERTAQLQAINKELESFSYSVSHDLRAPLRAINGFSKILEQQNAAQLDEDGKRLLSIIKTNANTMGNLIDDLLEFSRTGRTDIHSSEVDMTALVRAILAETDKGLAQIEVEPLPLAYCDATMMKHVWVNLISNAIKYSARKEQPLIRIWSTQEDKRSVYHIQDNGVGFDMQYASKLFGVFQRLHSPREFEGTGVGLAIVYRIIGKHAGQTWAHAELDKGATFHFSLPKTTNPSLINNP